jgi:hypothetical protein
MSNNFIQVLGTQSDPFWNFVNVLLDFDGVK